MDGGLQSARVKKSGRGVESGGGEFEISNLKSEISKGAGKWRGFLKKKPFLWAVDAKVGACLLCHPVL
jgi:hypothetical protein